MTRLGFGARLALIFVFSLLAIQLLALMAYYMQRGRSTDTGFRLPLPDQVAAIVELVENTPPEQRGTLLRAVNSPKLRVRVEPDKPQTPPPETWQESAFVRRTLERYLAALGEREVTVLIETQLGPANRKRHLFLFAPAATLILVKLKTGETLAIDTTDVLYISVFGFPPGFWAGLIGFLIALVTIILVRREARPLRQLAAAVDAMNLPDNPEPIPDAPKSAPEIRALIGAFNRLSERIARLLNARMALVGGISHDLRTYATRLRLRTEKIADVTERAKAERDISEMIELLDNALLAIRDGGYAQSQELVDLDQLLRRELEDRLEQGSDVQLSVNWKASETLVLGDALSLRRLFSNIIENAILYGYRAAIGATVTDAEAIIVIDDNGPGVPPEMREKVTEPFVRLEESRNRKTGGAGLGLAVAKNVAEAHGGSLKIGDAPSGGSRVIVRLPLFDPQRSYVKEPQGL